MGQAKELTSAIQAVVANRSNIVSLLNLNPDVFDAWLNAAANDKGSSVTQQALLIISSWIQGLPELREARETIRRACAQEDKTTVVH